MIITKIEKEKCKFYKEIQKLLSKYGFQDDAVADDKLQTLEAENIKLRQEIKELQKRCEKYEHDIKTPKPEPITMAPQETVDYAKIIKLLGAIGKGTFKNCYNVIAANYNGDREIIKHAIDKYGFETTGKHYSINSINTKTTCSCTIFKNGWGKEALHLCE